jgi:hypothetical protein
MNTSRTLQQIRPDVEPFDPAWSAETLSRITQGPTTRRSHRRLRIAALTTAVVMGTAGAAYATGVVPALISHEFGNLSTSKIHDEHRVASFTLGSGDTLRTFRVWRGTNGRGDSCAVVVEAHGRSGSPLFGGGCHPDAVEAWFGYTTEASAISEPTRPLVMYVYGEPASSAVRQVRVHGEGFNHITEVDPRTGGYAVAIPEGSTASHVERAGQVVAFVDFLDGDGHQVATHTLRDY